ncbi:immunoglobulin-like and fibronectin type III domain-containing protein 1 [Melanotaenia boesemani]|uniref:immunoglobulin-like and fibronectin type III domain-containing protein 1 n=1 Tax=Melanotaenia boesemani TaxID=1250792 RepID=UPI001C04918C|nr:immunoglobulin-like and fibronectin type III domain-containing protein 1 [Melanotaenia boesemani]
MLNADRRDYERICSEYGVTDLNVVLKKLEEKKKDRRQNKQKDNVIPYDDDDDDDDDDNATEKCGNKSVGRTKEININGQRQHDSAVHQGDVEEVNFLNRQLKEAGVEDDLLLTEFKLSNVDFVIKIQEITVQERDHALFECVLTHPLPKITWMKKGVVLEDGEKYGITVSDQKLIHRLLIKDCNKLDKAIYSAVAGITSCSAWLVVEDESNTGGKRTLRKITLAGGIKADLEKVAKEQQKKNREEIEKILEAVKAKHAAGQLKEGIALTCNGEDWNGMDKTGKTKCNISKEDGKALKVENSGCVEEVREQLKAGDPISTKYTKGRAGFHTVADLNAEKPLKEKRNPTGTVTDSRYLKQCEEMENGEIESSDECVAGNQLQMLTESQLEMIESSGNKNQRDSVRNQRRTKKVQWKEDESDLTKQATDNDENEDTAGQTTYGGISKKSKKPKSAAANVVFLTDPNEQASDNETSDNNGNQASAGQAKHQRGSKKSKKPKNAVANDSNEQVSDNEPSDNEEEDSAGQTTHQGRFKKSKKSKNAAANDSNEASDEEPSDNEDEDSAGLMRIQGQSKQSKKLKDAAAIDESTFSEDHCGCKETEEVGDSSSHARRKRQGPLIEELVIDPGVHIIWGLSDVNAIIREAAELRCKLSSEACEGAWFRDGKKISPDNNFSITKDGAIHKLAIIKCEEEHSGKYRFEADGRKTEAMLNVKDPPRFNTEDLSAFTEPLTVKMGHNAVFKLQFVGHKPIKIQWYREGEELQEDNNTKMEKSESHSRLLLIRCQRKDTGEIKIKLKNEHGFTEAISQLIVLDKPTSPLGPAEVTESSATCVEFKWRPPKDDGGSPVIGYILERQQVGRNTWKKIGEVPGVPSYRDTDVDRGRKYCYRIRAVTSEGTSEVMETDEMQAGTFALPGPPAPPKVISAFNDCINLTWASPSNTGGSRILGYILEKRKKGSNLWTVVNADDIIKEKKYGVKDVVEGMEYEFRVSAINLSGAGEFSNASEFVFARDPKKPPGKVTGLKVAETSYTNMVLTWTKPEEKPSEQDEAKGYFVEIRQADCIEWSRCNSTPIIMTSFNVKGLKSMDMYWVRVIATNDGGESAPEELPNYVLAMPSPVRPKFTNKKMKSFMVVKAGNSVRITVSFEASPWPDIMWLKDNVPVTKHVTVSNSDGSSQLLIPSSERSDSGIYSILVKNLVGQETLSTEVRVTDDPKPPGPVQLEENVPGTVTVIWEPSPDEKRDDRLHYTVSKLDSYKHTWTPVADRLFNNRFTVCNIIHGREYHFRVYAKNDMGISEPSESSTWGMEKKKEKFVASEPSNKVCDLQCAPSFIVPLKLHTAIKGYECYMSCAVKGNPTPRITWYRNHVSLNTDTNYYISNTFGVCSMLILRVGPKDVGEFTVIAENSLGRAECSTVLSVRD